MTPVPVPTRTPVLDENGTASRPWIAFHQWVDRRLKELADLIASGGGGGLMDGYEDVVLGGSPGGTTVLALAPDFSAYQGMTYAIFLDRSVLLLDLPVVFTPAGDFIGKRVTFIIRSGGPYEVVNFSSSIINWPTMAGGVDLCIEGRFLTDGSYIVTSAYQPTVGT